MATQQDEEALLEGEEQQPMNHRARRLVVALGFGVVSLALTLCSFRAKVATPHHIIGLSSAGESSNAGPCSAPTLDGCVRDARCHWFSVSTPCEHCQEWISEPSKFSGCRAVDPFQFCRDVVDTMASKAKSKGIDKSNPVFVDTVRHFHLVQGAPSTQDQSMKRRTCDVWCEGGACSGQPRQDDPLRGINYGGRFVPEKFLGLYGTDEYMYNDVTKPNGMRAKSICDIETPDAGQRMARFLDDNIKREHFARMASFGFNIVRLPVAYWNLVDLPNGETPDGPPSAKARWQRLQGMMKAGDYRKWLDRVFEFAKGEGIRIIMDLHSAPGGQSGNECTGCDQGPTDAILYLFGPDGQVGRNVDLTVSAMEAMAKLCAEKQDTCYGIELMNEPYGAHTDALYAGDLIKDLEICGERRKAGLPCNGIDMLFSEQQLSDTKGLISRFNRSKRLRTEPPPVRNVSRVALKELYDRGIAAARKHMKKEQPVVVMDWPTWLSWWADNANYTTKEHGRIVFATHVYHFPQSPTVRQEPSRAMFARDIQRVHDFFLNSGYELIFTEWALNSHGSGGKDDHFDYNAFTDWSVHLYNQYGIGSMLWNYDSYWKAWGSVASPKVGNSEVEWMKINAV